MFLMLSFRYEDEAPFRVKINKEEAVLLLFEQIITNDTTKILVKHYITNIIKY